MNNSYKLHTATFEEINEDFNNLINSDFTMDDVDYIPMIGVKIERAYYDTLPQEVRANLMQLNPEQMEQRVLEMMGALGDQGMAQMGDMENPLPTPENLAGTLQRGDQGFQEIMQPQTQVGRDAVKKMADLQEIGGSIQS